MTDMKIGEITKKEGFKLDYSRLLKAKKECELKKTKQDCKKQFEDMGVTFFDDD